MTLKDWVFREGKNFPQDRLYIHGRRKDRFLDCKEKLRFSKDLQPLL